MKKSRQLLFDKFKELGIKTRTHEHQAAFTVEDARLLRGQIEGGHCKNLFLKDKKGELWLIICLEDAQIDLKRAPKLIGSARLSFGNSELMIQTLDVTPGSVSPFGLINDTDQRVNVVLEQKMMQSPLLNFHPLENTATTTISSQDLLLFIQSCGHTPQIINFEQV